MRVSTANTYEVTIAALQKRQQQMQNSQQQLTTGKRVAWGSDDPTAAGIGERAYAQTGRIDANQRALDASRNAMTLGESALGDGIELLQQVREALVEAGNASYSDAERAGLANKISGLRQQLLAIANRGDGANGYIFGGQGSGGAPFLDQNGGVVFKGTPGVLQTGNSDNFQLSIDGGAAFEQARSGNGTFVTGTLPNVNTGAAAGGWIDSGTVTDPAQITGGNYVIQIAGTAPSQTYTISNSDTGTSSSDVFSPGKAIQFEGMSLTIAGGPVDGDQFSVAPSTNTLKVFDVLDNAIAALNTPLRSGAQIAQANSSNLRDLDAVMGNLQNVRSQVGETMNNLDGTEQRMATQKLNSQTTQSNAEDLDMVQGISNFQNQQSGYQAALQTYAMVQRMSLFQYLSPS
ncbi:flagellar hook-associated protein FlgL [Paucibacter sp. R3-3]|uniref:Flagellar hook-associated protein FlgL n=1 Tax=Roseateles agri TaxID=3098619 RepID=A0ABU5DQH3_9BURK|nr:flagellar hook-associated protein FlgL [Paucibacter sp. R3-3]MDY0748359.1 flagellar hook-associated protein FlgL [Paucibacter sp. R3-3]